MRTVAAAGLLLALCTAGCRLRGEEASGPRAIVLVSLDTVRRDRLGAYGSDRPTSPTLDAFAAEGAVFEDAIAQGTQTAPSHASFFTGLYPHRHGVEWNGELLGGAVPTLAETLRAAGWSTAGFVSGFPMRTEASALDRGFTTWDDDFDGRRRDGRETVERAISWLASQRGEPFFLFLHLYDAHGPYRLPDSVTPRFPARTPPVLLSQIPGYQVLQTANGEVVKDLHEYVARYETLVRYEDDLLRTFLAALPSDALVVVTSDHGETLGERAWPLDHGGAVWEEQIRIPLLMRGPGIPAQRIPGTVQGVDLFPTLASLALGECPGEAPDAPCADLDGRDLSPVLRGEPGTRPIPFAFSTARASRLRLAPLGLEAREDRPILTVRTHKWKLISYPVPEGSHLELYDLDSDPAESRSVLRENPGPAAALREVLDAWYDRGTADSKREPEPLDPRVREQLKALGYLD